MLRSFRLMHSVWTVFDLYDAQHWGGNRGLLIGYRLIRVVG